ncbi:endoribonuclease LACTB2-like [Watersipora subatra]|uniref:endoribonuclease LACTB2-like n=1 Tax=Watersipora subatra TaxID=2589382 RepID=UPI00355AF394
MGPPLTPLDKIRYLSKRVICILGCNPSPMTLLGTNTYLVGSGRERILIDTGNPNILEYQQLLNKVLDDTKSVISKIIVTHFHHDHIGGLADVRRLCNANIPAYKMDFMSAAERSKLGEYQSEVELIEGNHTFEVNGATLKARHNPGHTSDHMVLWLEEEKALFSADSVLGEGTTMFTNLSHYMKSLQQIRDMKPEVIYPGHGPVVRNPAEHVDYYISHRQEREDQIVALLKETPRSAKSIVKVLYKDYPEAVHGHAADIMILHLRKLFDDQKVTYKDEDVNTDTLWKLREPHAGSS